MLIKMNNSYFKTYCRKTKPKKFYLNDNFIKIALLSLHSILYYSLIRRNIMDVYRVSPLTGRVYRYPK